MVSQRHLLGACFNHQNQPISTLFLPSDNAGKGQGCVIALRCVEKLGFLAGGGQMTLGGTGRLTQKQQGSLRSCEASGQSGRLFLGQRLLFSTGLITTGAVCTPPPVREAASGS